MPRAIYLVPILDLLLQFTAAVLALRLIRVTGKITAWALLSLAIGFLVLHRVFETYRALSTGIPPAAVHDFSCLAISALAVVGLALIAPVFRRLRDSEEQLRQSEEKYRTIVETAHEGIVVLDAQDRFIFVNQRISEIFGYRPSEVLGRHVLDFFDEAEKENIRQNMARRRQGTREVLEIHLPRKDGSYVWATSAQSPILDPNGQYLGAIGLLNDITSRKQAEESARIRADQQAAVATLGLNAIAGATLADLFNEAVALIAKHLKVEYAKMLELLPGGNSLLLRAGVGWQPGLVGAALVEADPDSQAGYTLSVKGPVVVPDLRTETRFTGPALLREHNVVSGLSVIIAGRDQPFGVLGAHTSHQQNFTRDDINFLQAVANVLAGAIEINRSEQALSHAADKLRFLTTQLLSAQEKERQKISLELHEDLGQTLQALKLQTGHIKRGLEKDQPRLCQECEDLVLHFSGIIDRVRGLAWELRPNLLEDLGLLAALRHLIDDFCRHYKMEQCQTDFDEVNGLLPLSAKLHIFRIFQEALTNIGEHAGATQVVLTIKRHADGIDFILADNGKGFVVEEVMSQPEKYAGLGLHAIEERVQLLGGKLAIGSRARQGTELRFRLPIPAQAGPGP